MKSGAVPNRALHSNAFRVRVDDMARTSAEDELQLSSANGCDGAAADFLLLDLP